MHFAIGFNIVSYTVSKRYEHYWRSGGKVVRIDEKSERRREVKIQIPPPHLERGYLHNLRPLVISEIQ